MFPLRWKSLRIASAMGWCLALVLGLLMANKAYADGPPNVVIQQVNTSEYPRIKAAVEVVDGSGVPIAGLTRKDISVFENNSPVGTLTFDSSVDVSLPLGVMLVLDTSGSMKGTPLSDAKSAASTFVDQLGAQDQVALITFSSAVTVVKDLTINKDEVKQALNAAQAVGDTRLYDALYVAAEKLTAVEMPRKIIVLLTDGEDTMSGRKLKDGVQLASSGGILVFTIGIGPSVKRTDLDSMAAQTGGTSIYSPTSAMVAQAFQTIAQRLRSYYVLSYTTSLLGEPAQRTLTVEVTIGSQKISGKRDFTLEFSPVSFEITSPIDGQPIEDDFNIEVQVNQPQLVAEMDFQLDGVSVRKLSSSPFSIPVKLSSLVKGSHTITILVRDAFGVEKSKRITFVIPGAGSSSVTSTADGKAGSRWFSVLDSATSHPTLPIGLVFAISGVVGVAREVIIRARGTRCPICGLTYREKGGCPRCLGSASNPKRPLGQMLVTSKLITSNELSSSLADSLAQNRRLGEVLVEKGLVHEDDLTNVLRIQQKRGTYASRRDGVAYGNEAKASSKVGLIFYLILLGIGGLLLLLFQYNIL